MSLNLINPFMKFASGGGGAGTPALFEQLAQVTLSSQGNLDIASFTGNPYMMWLMFGQSAANDGSGSTIDSRFAFNNTTVGSTAYAVTKYDNGATTGGTDVNFYGYSAGAWNIAYDFFAYGYMSTPETAIKGQYSRSIQSTGQGVAPYRNESTGKFDETSNLITEWHDYYTTESGSNLTILGFDPSDTNATPIWEKLAQATNSGSTTAELNSGTFTAKKYLWIQFYDTNTINYRNKITFNSDSGTNYQMRYARDMASDATETGQTKFKMGDWGWYGTAMHNFLIVNPDNTNKYCISETTKAGQSGASNAPHKTELVGQWDDNAEVTSVQMSSENSGGAVDIGADSFITVWGFDP